MSRYSVRAKFSQPVRLQLVEEDIDTLEEGQKKLVDAVDRVWKVLVKILVSVTTASILLALNVILIGSK